MRNRAESDPPKPLPTQPTLRIASWNVHKCVGTDGRFDPGRIAEVIAEIGPDLIALQEVDRRFGRRIGLLDLGQMERRTGLTLLPASPLADGHGWHGNAILVRRGLARTLALRRLELPGAEPRGALVTDLAVAGAGRLRVVAAHLGLLRRSREKQVRTILDAILDGGAAPPTLLLGDFNEWRMQSRGRCSLVGLESIFGRAPKMPDSFPSRLPLLALDRILGFPRGLVGPVTTHHSALARVASDHLPLVAVLRLAATMDPPQGLNVAA
ncbi:MAG: endonuclease/exonuclease/phosphatase family protein [Acetobacteraceae bacterium]|nr:endonuclease/exonuclease/phosphatase family protein [Acetobacteraceae bacterium]